MSTTTITRRWTRLTVAITTLILAFASWLRGSQPIDDRGSDSSEKAFMLILAISAGTAVSTAALLFIASKTKLFE